MRLRLLAFIPPAALVTMVLFTLTSSLVSALETSLVIDRVQSIDVRRLESTEREYLDLGREVGERCDRRTAPRIERSAARADSCPSIIEEEFSAGQGAAFGPATFMF